MGVIETCENPHQGRDCLIRHAVPKFTSVCPKIGQPDFGAIKIEDMADKRRDDLRSLRLCLQGRRSMRMFHEDAVSRISDDLLAMCPPQRMTVRGRFTPGGIHSVVGAEGKYVRK